MRTRLTISVLALLICTYLLAETYSGTCGNNLTWTLTEDSVLTISGTGEMDDYGWSREQPWIEHVKQIKALVVENGVTRIGNEAFMNCQYLESAIIGNDVFHIGDGVFSYAAKLKTITLGTNVMILGSNVFFGCSELSAINLPNNLGMIGSGAFTDCVSLTSVELPSNLIYLESCVFANCENLVTIVLPENLEGIGSNSFQGCETLASLTIPDKVTDIESAAFIGCRNMRSITLPTSLKSLGYGVFCDCRSLDSITIPKSTINIGDAVFLACDSLSSIVVEDGNPVYDSRDNCNAIIHTATNTLHAGCRRTFIPASVNTIGSSAFQNISTLRCINIPNNVTVIDKYAFSGTGISSVTFPNGITSLSEYVVGECLNLKSITIPASVTKVGWWVFANDYNLDTVICYSSTPPAITENTFEYFYNQQSCHLYVPSESIDLYESTDGWKDFLNILPIGEGISTSVENATLHKSSDKILRDGQILILRGDKTYTLQGQEVK